MPIRNHDRPGGVSRRGMLAATAVAGTAALTGGLTGCSTGDSGDSDKIKDKVEHPSDNLQRTGFPIVKDPVTIHFMTQRPESTAKDWNKVAVWEKYQKMTNIKINWGLVPGESLDEKRNLALSSGDYPEAFYGGNISVRDVGKYGGQGVFIKLNDLIDKYMPNLKKLMDDNPDIKQGMTFPNGAVYGLPWIIDPDFTAFRIQYKPWVRGDWLDKFDMTVPSTTKEYYAYLKMVKSKAPNGKKDTIPFGSSHSTLELYNALRGAFGVGNRGGYDYVDTDPGDQAKTRFFPAADEYKALLEYMHKLYGDGLIAQNIFSVDYEKAMQGLSKGTYGSTVEIAPYELRGGQAKHFVPMPALKGPDGEHAYNGVVPSLRGIGYFVITDKCKHPVELARWADYFYSDAGSKMYFMGVKGKSYKETKDGVEYVDKIKNPPQGMTQDEAQKPYVTYMGGYGGVLLKEEYFKGSEGSAESTKAAKLLEPNARHVLKNGWPEFTFTEDEFQQLESLADDIEKYVDESRERFISGHLKLSNWDTYVNKLKKMGLDDYMKIQQAAYDRYRKG